MALSASYKLTHCTDSDNNVKYLLFAIRGFLYTWLNMFRNVYIRIICQTWNQFNTRYKKTHDL